jgi:hypothetical protein
VAPPEFFDNIFRKPLMDVTDTTAASLPDVAEKLEKHINELRRAGDHPTLIASANAAADEIMRRIGENSVNAVEREALIRVKRFTFNAAADCWPGWGESHALADTQTLLGALTLAQRSAELVTKLGLGKLQDGTGTWLIGAFQLALGRYTEAARVFDRAHEHYLAAKAPGLVLLTEGYAAIVREAAGAPMPGADDLDHVCAKIAAGSFEDGAEWIDQLRTASKVFAR